MRINYVLIDFENVQPESLALLQVENLKVFLFVGATQTKVPFEIASALQVMGNNAEYIKIAGSGKNALDFHITYYLGQLTEKDPQGYFHIISKDTGFDPLIQHLKTKKVLIHRSKSISELPFIKRTEAKSIDEKAKLFITRLQSPQASKPGSIKTLQNAIGSFFQKQLSETEIAEIVALMKKSGLIVIQANKITYPGIPIPSKNIQSH
ncbi:MAG: hypothetical protein IV090_05420 [Candidatus Sericytochromatia bacterium]|nr:hypothetical protein [Candidatus Sericytochromatia bacterium]